MYEVFRIGFIWLYEICKMMYAKKVLDPEAGKKEMEQ